MTLLGLCCKLVVRVDRRIDRARQSFCGVTQRFNDICQVHVPHDHYIDVACRNFIAPCDRTVDEGNADFASMLGQRVFEHIEKTGCFGQKATQFRQDRALGIRSVVDASPVDALPQDTRLNESLKIAYKRGRPDSEVLGKVGEVPPPLRLHHGNREDAQLCRREQDGDRMLLSHNA